MRALIVKTSSMGDVIHALPALTDAIQAIPAIRFDWVVESGFQAIPRWHPAVARVIPLSLRAWRKQLFSVDTWQQFFAFRRTIQETHYDVIIDAQGLLKSALIATLANGPRFGLSRHSARELFAVPFYQHKIAVPREQHAIARVRALFSAALAYVQPDTEPNYGIQRVCAAVSRASKPYVVFFHGTTWATKHWPVQHWQALARKAVQFGYLVKLPWGNAVEQARAIHIAEGILGVEVLPKLDLSQIAPVIAGAAGVVSVDTGLGHLAAALSVPGVSLYGPTRPGLSGSVGVSQAHIAAEFPCAPCFKRHCTFRGPSGTCNEKEQAPPCLAGVSPESVWMDLERLLQPCHS